MKKFLMKFDRVSAWSLVAVMVAYFVTGYGQTKEIIPPDLAKFIHDKILPLPSIVAFAFHSAYGMHVALKRWKVWGRPWSLVLVLYAAILVVGVAVMQFSAGAAAGAIEVPLEIEL